MVNDSDPLVPFAEGIWLSTAPVSFLCLKLTVTTTVMRLADGTLLIHSPGPLTTGLRARIDACGPTGHLYAPNLLHHRWLADWAAAWPQALIHAPRGLARKQPGLRVDRVHGDPPDRSFGEVLTEVSIDGFRLREAVLLVRPARVLVVADLVQNVGRPSHGWTATYARVMGFYDRVALSRMIRWSGFDDRRAARRSIDHALEQDFDGLVVGHGRPLESGGRAALQDAYAWLAG